MSVQDKIIYYEKRCKDLGDNGGEFILGQIGNNLGLIFNDERGSHTPNALKNVVALLSVADRNGFGNTARLTLENKKAQLEQLGLILDNKP